jgi:aspartyl-tRNA(Asn)/glutamyl-tRNA(Gln) amidotransferase subunit A
MKETDISKRSDGTQNGLAEWKKLAGDAALISAWKNGVTASDASIGSFLEFDAASLAKAASGGSTGPGPLASVPFAVKDNIAIRDFHLTCGSKLLENVVSPYTATAVRKIEEAGGIVVGKTNLDEFGMGSSTQDSALKKTANPRDLSRVPGGSSGGSAAAVAAGFVPFALGSDTGGSVRQPASFCGVYGLKPTYGSVSRYGLVAYASSLEVIGAIAPKVDILRLVFETMKGVDPMDHSTVEHVPPALPKGPVTIALPRECVEHGLSPEVKKTLDNTKKTLEKLGCRIVECTLPTLEYVVPAYYTIATAEASANLARFDGVRYGTRARGAENPEELVVRSRSGGFGNEVKLRILLGTFVLRSGYQDQYYLRAQKIRTAIRDDLARVYESAHLVLMPVFPTPPFGFGASGLSPFEQKKADIFTCTANLAGLPALSFPAGTEGGLPIGMQLMAPPFAEELLFSVTERFESECPGPSVPDLLHGKGK